MAKAEKIEEIKKPKKFNYKTVKKLTGVEFLMVEPHKPVFVKITGVIFRGTLKKKPASSVPVVNLETGEVMKLLLGKVLERQLLESYGDEGFVNKSFRIEKGERVKGQENEYFEFEVEEIEAD